MGMLQAVSVRHVAFFTASNVSAEVAWRHQTTAAAIPDTAGTREDRPPALAPLPPLRAAHWYAHYCATDDSVPAHLHDLVAGARARVAHAEAVLEGAVVRRHASGHLAPPHGVSHSQVEGGEAQTPAEWPAHQVNTLYQLSV